MFCPSCGLAIEQPHLDRCPRCGRTLTPTPVTPVTPVTLAMSQAPHEPATPATPPGQAPSASGAAYPQGILAPLPERKRSRTRQVIGIAVAVIVLLAACTGGGMIWAMHSQGQLPTNDAETPAASASPGEVIIYGERFSSSANGWAHDPGHCYLDSDGYHARSGYVCFAPISAQTDASISVTVQQMSGPTTEGYGLAFRLSNDDKASGYQFVIDSAGEWAFDKCVNKQCTTLVNFTSNSAIKGGLNTTNILKVRATESHFDFFVNDTKVGSFDDATFAAGFVGILGGEDIDCVFTDFAVLIPTSS